MDGLFSGSSLQSGFVLAVIIAAVLLAHRLGGPWGLAQKAAQVALGVILMMLVFSATAAFHGWPQVPPGILQGAMEHDTELVDAMNAYAGEVSQIGTIHIGLGIIFVALGVVLLQKTRAVSPGLLLGGILLILLGGRPEGVADDRNPLFAATAFFLDLPGTLGEAGTPREAARFVVLAIGTLLLAGLLCLWNRKSGTAESNDAEDSPME